MLNGNVTDISCIKKIAIFKFPHVLVMDHFVPLCPIKVCN